MKKIFATSCLAMLGLFSFAQKPDDIINAKEVERIERVLSADDMQGRRPFTPGIDKAADFIASEFKKIGLETWNNSGDYKQTFTMVRPKFISASAVLDGAPVDQKKYCSGYFTTRI